VLISWYTGRIMNDSPSIIEASQQSFEHDAIERSFQAPVLVVFGAEWCAPCRVVGAVLEQRASQYDGKFFLVKVDIEMIPDIATRFGVRSIPAVVALKEGQVVDSFLGALPESAIRSFLDAMVSMPTEALAADLKKWQMTDPGSLNSPSTKRVTVFTAYRDGRELGIDSNGEALIRTFKIEAGSARAQVSASEEAVGLVEGKVLTWSAGATKLHWVCPKCGLQQWGDWTPDVPNPCLWYSNCPCIDKWLIHWEVGDTPTQCLD
jgi:thioredoxin